MNEITNITPEILKFKSSNINQRECIRVSQPTRKEYITVITNYSKTYNRNNKFQNNNILGGTNARSRILVACVEINSFSLWFGTHCLVWRIKVINSNER